MILRMDVRKKLLKEKGQKQLQTKNTILLVIRVFHFGGFMETTPQITIREEKMTFLSQGTSFQFPKALL